MQLLTKLNQQGIIVLIITHDDTMAAYCRRRIMLQDGLVIADR